MIKYSAKDIKQLADTVWSQDKWERGMPTRQIRKVYSHMLECAKNGKHRKIAKDYWQNKKHEYFQHRANVLFRIRVTPYYGAGQWWAIPYEWVICESGGRGYVTSGYYGILKSTWHYYGRLGVPGEYEKKEQDIVAHQILVDTGPSAWECSWL